MYILQSNTNIRLDKLTLHKACNIALLQRILKKYELWKKIFKVF